jgi:hypothetical protein
MSHSGAVQAMGYTLVKIEPIQSPTSDRPGRREDYSAASPLSRLHAAREQECTPKPLGSLGGSRCVRSSQMWSHRW